MSEEVPVSRPTTRPEAGMTTLDGDVPCVDCGTNNNIVWFTESVFWNNVCTEDFPILCLRCFIIRAERKFKPVAWKVTPEWPWAHRGGDG